MDVGSEDSVHVGAGGGGGGTTHVGTLILSVSPVVTTPAPNDKNLPVDVALAPTVIAFALSIIVP